jgi:hypothetical protein
MFQWHTARSVDLCIPFCGRRRKPGIAPFCRPPSNLKLQIHVRTFAGPLCNLKLQIAVYVPLKSHVRDNVRNVKGAFFAARGFAQSATAGRQTVCVAWALCRRGGRAASQMPSEVGCIFSRFAVTRQATLRAV